MRDSASSWTRSVGASRTTPRLTLGHGETPRQIALNFLTRRPSLFTIPKASNVDHVRENAGGTGWELNAEDVQLIDSVFPAPSKDEPLDMF